MTMERGSSEVPNSTPLQKDKLRHGVISDEQSERMAQEREGDGNANANANGLSSVCRRRRPPSPSFHQTDMHDVM